MSSVFEPFSVDDKRKRIQKDKFSNESAYSVDRALDSRKQKTSVRLLLWFSPRSNVCVAEITYANGFYSVSNLIWLLCLI